MTTAPSTRGPDWTQPLPVTPGQDVAALVAWTEIPEDAGARPPITIGNQVAAEMPGFDMLPCGHCHATFDAAPADLTARTHVLGILNWLAAQAGWRFDADWTWTCPACQQGEEWKARQRPVAARLPGPPDATVSPSETCKRHAGMDGGRRAHKRCTCPGAVLAVDVMLASKDYEDIDALAAAAQRRSRLRFDRLATAAHPGAAVPGRHRADAPQQQRGAA